MKIMKILVTGGAGFVGSHLIENLVESKHEIIVIDNLSSGKLNYIKKYIKQQKIKFVNADITQSEIFQFPKVDVVIHLAAIASVIKSITNPKLVNDVNVSGTLNILEFCRRKKIPKLIFFSSAAIYGNYQKQISEKTEIIPTTVYGSTKMVGEDYCRIYNKLFGIKCIIFRPFNIYGKRQNKEYAGVISKFDDKIKMNQRPIIFGSGKQTRDFINVKDVVRAINLAVNEKKILFKQYNLATGNSTTINHLAKIMLKISKKNRLTPIYKSPIKGVVIHSSANIDKIQKELRFFPEIELSEGLKKIIFNIK